MKLIFPILCLIISGLVFFAVVDPMYNDVSKLRADVAAYNVALNNSTELQKKRDSLVEVYKNIKKEDKIRLEHFLPNTVNNIRFILEIEQIAKLYNMPIKNIKFESQKSQETKSTAGNIVISDDPLGARPYGVFPIEFTTEGTYEMFSSFLKDIENNLRLVDVKAVSFIVPGQEKPAVGVNPNIYTYTLRVETYWLK